MEDWQIVFSVAGLVLVVLVPLLLHIKKSNSEAHGEIKGNIEKVEDKIGKNIERVEGKVDAGFKVVNSDIKVLIRSVGRLEGRQTMIDGRPSEGGQD